VPHHWHPRCASLLPLPRTSLPAGRGGGFSRRKPAIAGAARRLKSPRRTRPLVIKRPPPSRPMLPFSPAALWSAVAERGTSADTAFGGAATSLLSRISAAAKAVSPGAHCVARPLPPHSKATRRPNIVPLLPQPHLLREASPAPALISLFPPSRRGRQRAQWKNTTPRLDAVT
jgi:hypothetical protein